MKFNDQNRPYRRCLSEAGRSAYQCFVHIADLSAWGAHRRTIGRYIGGAAKNCAPTGYERKTQPPVRTGLSRPPQIYPPGETTSQPLTHNTISAQNPTNRRGLG